MKLLLKIIKKFIFLSFIIGLFLTIIFIIGTYFYKLTNTDLNLIRELDELLKYQSAVIHIPSGWNVVSDTECNNASSYIISYPQGDFFNRQLLYSYKIHDIHFCIEKSLNIPITIFDFFCIGLVILIISGMFTLLFFVIKMYMFTYVWKRIVNIQNANKLLVFNESVKNDSVDLTVFFSEIILMPRFSIGFIKEFSPILVQVNQEISVMLEQKKIPEQYVREFQLLSNTFQRF